MKNELADYLFHQGTNYKSYEYLGSHLTVEDGVKGVIFRVWAPSADSVSLVGDFNGWDTAVSPMVKLDGGVWELFVKDLKVYDTYKYAISANGKVVLKSDPYAYHAETTPANASKVYDLSGYEWNDKEFVAQRDPIDFIINRLIYTKLIFCRSNVKKAATIIPTENWRQSLSITSREWDIIALN